MNMGENFLIDNLMRHIGQTVTIFTTSGGLSGSGFTGVLAGTCGCTIKLITDIGAPPTCPIGSDCDCDCGCDDGCGDGYRNGYGNGYGYGYGYGFGYNGYNGYGYGGRRGRRGRRDGCCVGRFGGRNWLGSVTVIPIDRIASFTHNAL
jgi:hypothetical protein